MPHKRHPDRQIVNFSAGPSAQPLDILIKAQKDLINYNGTELSVMELSHRSAEFSKIMQNTETLARELLSIPENYKVLFIQGGGNGQFAAVPMNLIQMSASRTADYFVTGYWSAKAVTECKKYGNPNLVFPKLDKFNRIPPSTDWTFSKDPAYIFICDNETIDGVEFNDQIIDQIREKCPNVPIIADASSNLFSRNIDVSKYGIIFAGAQKNFGPAGVTIVIIRDDLAGHAIKECPTIFDYKTLIGNGSLYQTPPTFGIYMCGLNFEWLKSHGGIGHADELNKLKSDLIYKTIDESNGFYKSPVELEVRSRMTIPFRLCQNGLASESLEKAFISEAAKMKLNELKGHRSVGGIRAAIFNALSLEEIEELVKFMRGFMERNQ